MQHVTRSFFKMRDNNARDIAHAVQLTKLATSAYLSRLRAKLPYCAERLLMGELVLLGLLERRLGLLVAWRVSEGCVSGLKPTLQTHILYYIQLSHADRVGLGH